MTEMDILCCSSSSNFSLGLWMVRETFYLGVCLLGYGFV